MEIVGAKFTRGQVLIEGTPKVGHKLEAVTSAWSPAIRLPVTATRSSVALAFGMARFAGGEGGGGGATARGYAVATCDFSALVSRARRVSSMPLRAAASAAADAAAAASAAASPSADSATLRFVVLQAARASAKPRAKAKRCGWCERCMVRLRGWVADGNAWVRKTGLQV